MHLAPKGGTVGLWVWVVPPRHCCTLPRAYANKLDRAFESPRTAFPQPGTIPFKTPQMALNAHNSAAENSRNDC